ncbi:unnamed protein product [Pleuronectes platessa]|uniref:Uncharacterized protein n=1 Tax=Pleuronectes platessa TaxID=8262 RepID=A0A9N7V2J8_PLEPL|nr:unnamed protein product [Pleuronectes platessa]
MSPGDTEAVRNISEISTAARTRLSPKEDGAAWFRYSGHEHANLPPTEHVKEEKVVKEEEKLSGAKRWSQQAGSGVWERLKKPSPTPSWEEEEEEEEEEEGRAVSSPSPPPPLCVSALVDWNLCNDREASNRFSKPSVALTFDISPPRSNQKIHESE